MPINRDYWNETIHTVYTDVIEIYEADEDQNPIDPVNGIIRLNSSGNILTIAGKQYMPATFTFNEPDRNSINDETGSLTIGGVTSEYIEMINAVDQEHSIVVRVGLANYETGALVLSMLNYVASNISVNSATATLQVTFKSGNMLLSYYISKMRYVNTEFPCLFG